MPCTLFLIPRQSIFSNSWLVRLPTFRAQTDRQLALIAESDLNDPRIIRPREIGGYGMYTPSGVTISTTHCIAF